MSVAETAKEVVRLASTAGLAKDVIDLMEKKLALITGELDEATRKNTLLEQRISQLASENNQLRNKVSASQPQAPSQPQISEGEIKMIKLLVASKGQAIVEEMANPLGVSSVEAEYIFDKLKGREFVFSGSGIMGRGNICSLTPTGRSYAVDNGLTKNLPPPAPPINEFGRY
jgi:chromosome segregation ATPase